MRKRRLFRTLCLALLLIVALIACELSSWLILTRLQPADWWQFHDSRPAAYANSPYYNAAFEREARTYGESWHFADDGMMASLYRGMYFNMDAPRVRHTTGQPATAHRTLYLFGSSTTVNIEVPDVYTIASYLQALTPAVRVENRGVIGTVAAQHLLLLKELDLRPGDVVVFLDGIGDAASLIKHSDRAFPCSLPLGSVQLACFLLGARYTPGTQVRTAEDVARRYVEVLGEAKRYTEAHGATFYHMLQPHIFSAALSGYEQSLVDNPNLVDPDVAHSIVLAYPALEAAVAGLPYSTSLYHSLDALRSGGVEIYLDYDHVTERGNEQIARAIYATIRQTF